MKHLIAFAMTMLMVGPAQCDEAGPLAERILKAASRPVGLVHLPRCGDGQLAVALAAADQNLRVHGQCADYDTVQAARKNADKRGLLGRRGWFDQGDLGRLLTAGRSVDLIVLTDLAAADLTPELAAEIRRVLHPWYGLAVLGAVSGKLEAASLKTWSGAIGKRVVEMPGQGTLVAVRVDPLPGADDWSMWWHGPDNNAVSTDTAFSLPATIQWTGKPYFGPTRLELPIVSGGRLFMLWNGHEMDSSRGPIILSNVPASDGPLLTAQAVGSGALLWTRRLSPAAWVQVSRSIAVGDGDRLLVADGNDLVELDGATGKDIRRKQFDCGEIKWMTLHDNRLFILGGALTESHGHRSEKAVVPFRSSGLNLIAIDRKTLDPIWRVDRQAGQGAFDPRSPAIDGDRLFIAGEDDTAEAFSVKDGKRLWHVKVGFDRTREVGYAWDRSSRHPVTGYAALGVYVISGLEMREAIVISQSDGKRLWTQRQPSAGQFMPLAFQKLLWKGDAGLDPLTGAEKRTIASARSGGCARDTISPQGYIEACGLSYDFIADRPGSLQEPMKTSCSAGSFVANGLFWKFPVPCTSCTEWRGFIVQAARDKAPKPAEQLQRRGETPAATGPAPQGWLTYRGNAARSSSTDATIPAAASIRWTAAPANPASQASRPSQTMMDAELVPTPPLVADRRVILAHADGAVDALDLVDGKRLWRAYTSGRVHSSPTIWRDRVLVGSADGYLYAFALADGRELWRLRAAPDAGRIMVYGQLGSRWPIVTAPLVNDDKVYVSAGLTGMIDGVHAVCADAASGRILWQRSDWTASESNGKISGGGQFALAGDELVYHGGLAPPIRIAGKDGACRPAFPETAAARLAIWSTAKWKTVKAFDAVWGRVKGQDVGVLSRDWIAYGGRRIWTDQAEEGTWRSTIKFLGRDRDGKGRLPVIEVQDAELLPAWDDRDAVFLYAAKRQQGIVSIPRETLRQALDALMAGTSTDEIMTLANKPPKDAITVPPELLSKAFTVRAEGLPRWNNPLEYRWTPLACVLARNALLVVTTRSDSDPAKEQPGKLTALNRADGKKLWEVNLPARAVHNGLAVAADGSAIVSLVDGQTISIAGGGRP